MFAEDISVMKLEWIIDQYVFEKTLVRDWSGLLMGMYLQKTLTSWD